MILFRWAGVLCLHPLDRLGTDSPVGPTLLRLVAERTSERHGLCKTGLGRAKSTEVNQPKTDTTNQFSRHFQTFFQHRHWASSQQCIPFVNSAQLFTSQTSRIRAHGQGSLHTSKCQRGTAGTARCDSLGNGTSSRHTYSMTLDVRAIKMACLPLSSGACSGVLRASCRLQALGSKRWSSIRTWMERCDPEEASRHGRSNKFVLELCTARLRNV